MLAGGLCMFVRLIVHSSSGILLSTQQFQLTKFFCIFVVSQAVPCPVNRRNKCVTVSTDVTDPAAWSFWRSCSKCPPENFVVVCSVPDLRGSEAFSEAANKAPSQGDLISGRELQTVMFVALFSISGKTSEPVHRITKLRERSHPLRCGNSPPGTRSRAYKRSDCAH
jgi:hypothetical protein